MDNSWQFYQVGADTVSEPSAEQSSGPYAFAVGQRVKCVTGERGHVLQRWLTPTGAKYMLSTDGDGPTMLVFESDLTEISITTPWAKA